MELIASSRFAVPSERRWTPVHSPSDNLAKTQQKMQEYIDNGTILGWLINPAQQQVEVYRRDKQVEILTAPDSLSGENILSGFVLDLKPIW